MLVIKRGSNAMTPFSKFFKEKERYTEIVCIRFPKTVLSALIKSIRNRKRKFPRYSVNDFIRTCVVEKLKDEGYLDKRKDFL